MRSIIRPCIAIAALCTSAPLRPATAQLSATVPVGATVRWSEDGKNRQGTVARVDDQAQVLWVDRRGVTEPVQVALGTPKLALRTRTNRKGTAAVIAFGAGFMLGVALGDDPPCKSTSGWFSFCSRSTAAEKGAVFGLMGGLFGVLVGQRAKWQLLAGPAGTPANRVSAIIEPDRLGIRVAF